MSEFRAGFGAYRALDPEGSTRVATGTPEERAMLGPSVHTLDTDFAELCAQEGIPLNEERLHGTGEYASVRLPKVRLLLLLILVVVTSLLHAA